MKSLVVVAISLMGAANVAAAPLAGFNLVASTPRFSHYARDTKKVDVEAYEKQLSRLESLLGATVDHKVEFYSYERPEEIAAVTGRYADGFFFPAQGQIHATKGAREHEMVHLVAHELGDPGAFFQEGLAVALGNHGKLGGHPVEKVAKRVVSAASIESLAGRARIEDWESVATAGAFVEWLIERHGVETVASFFRASGRSGSPAAFETSFGTSLRTASADFAKSLGVTSPVGPMMATTIAAPTTALAQLSASAR
jgi:hypothetical protein